MAENFSDAALVIVAHGSTVNEDSKTPALQHVAELRRRKIFADVKEAFWKEQPYIKDVVAGLSTRRVFIVPLFISEGYFTTEAIPHELGLVEADGRITSFPATQERGAQKLVYCGPIGTHATMTDALLARAKGIIEAFPFPRAPKPSDITLFIAGHGTGRNENSRKAIEQQVELIRARKIYADAHAVFMEEPPVIAECYKLANAKNIVMVPFFISDGMHTNEDIPVLLGEPERFVKERLKLGQPTWRNPTEKNGKRVWYSASIGTEPYIADLILERVRETARATT